ncbi:MAG: class I SAM-dependent methyltransferase [Anaerolineaceae bacterium]|jgi:predicted O-methyltransferase YrrM
MKIIDRLKTRIKKWYWTYFWDTYQLPEEDINNIIENYTEHVPSIMEEICIPPYHGDKGLLDYPILISIVKSMQPKIILELGTAHGNTVANICAESNAKIYTVNALPQQIEGEVVTFNLSRETIGSVYIKNGYKDRVTQIYANTKDMDLLNYMEPKSVDLAFIDACHDFDFVINDFHKILPILSEDGVILFHDVHPSCNLHYAGSYFAGMYLRTKGFNVRYISGSSLGIWAIKEEKTSEKERNFFKHLFFYLIGRSYYGNGQVYIDRVSKLKLSQLKY